jgi:cytochrome c-type biogenesis protein CcmH/NrfF
MSKFRRVLIALLASSTVLAAENTQTRGKPDFVTMKQQVLKRLNAELSCLEAANNENTMQACKPRPQQGGPDDQHHSGNPPPPN